MHYKVILQIANQGNLSGIGSQYQGASLQMNISCFWVTLKVFGQNLENENLIFCEDTWTEN